ncbi:hypothetical protein SAMN02745671_01144 [Anaerovibrio lipolyticus DSM 3074]|uniref:Uncharacterized protein n=1 Tax=Anaerovibrio lipolyticus DSM 3074 TaxID=1120997 RepID=A0A1M6CJM8_9FIRM|nr:hypothetical protein [Anaerovibrio lipolyticus]SHI61207.1 hypothetical protein SAMN02745671_01144 [Anaerovibrio lipolyticus DSM 3074]
MRKYVSYDELRSAMFKANEEGKEISGGITFTEDSFNKPYDERGRTYLFTSDNKAFQHGKISNSIWANCEDGTDDGVKLSNYLYDWKIEKCFIES